MLTRLDDEDVPFAIANSETLHEVRRDFPRVMVYVDSRYEEIVRFDVAPGKALIVFADSHRPVASRVGVRSLPCFRVGT